MFRRPGRKPREDDDWIHDAPVVTEGRLLEMPTPDATGVERRAFGEFEGVRGELASYAIGWTTGQDDHVGRISIGIGVGNEGGGTFHAVVLATEEGHAIRLVDEPFEDVPQGGPDLTREEALAHEDLPFVFMVSDVVMLHDRRAHWMGHWLLRTRAVVTAQVFDLAEPVLLLVHDDDDHEVGWQAIGRTDAAVEGAVAVHLWHLVDEDHTLLDVLDLRPGERAERERRGAEWRRYGG